MAYSQEYIDLLERMKQLHKDKNAGYAGDSEDPWANFRECTKFGITVEQGIVTRILDKYMRFKSLWNNPDNDKVGESLDDTLLDLMSYIGILLTIRAEKKHSTGWGADSEGLLPLERHVDVYYYTYKPGSYTVKE